MVDKPENQTNIRPCLILGITKIKKKITLLIKFEVDSYRPWTGCSESPLKSFVNHVSYVPSNMVTIISISMFHEKYKPFSFVIMCAHAS